MFRSPLNKESWSYVHSFEENSKNCARLWDDRGSFGAILQANPANFQYVQK